MILSTSLDLYQKVMRCNDGPGCEGTSMDVCRRFRDIENRCPKTCKKCKCQDLKDCQGVTEKHCKSIPETLNKTCSLTCGVCGNSNGNLIELNFHEIDFDYISIRSQML